MKRRTFISTTVLGVLSVNQLLASPPVELTQPDMNKWLSQLLNAIDSRQRKRYLLTDKALTTAYETTKEEWFSSGYQALGNDYFLCRNENLALFPIELQHRIYGQIDISVLVFEKKNNNEWESLKSLSGFNIEALAKSVNALSANVDDLVNYILPTKSTTKIITEGYKTPKGQVLFDTRITEDRAIVNAQIVVKNEAVWNTEYESTHTLS